MSGAQFPAAVAAIAALGDPTRRALYRYIAAQGGPVGREDAAAAVGVPHHVARFHLDRLHEAGLLEVEYKRPAGRGGPGAGRPAKLYRPGPAEFSVSVPERRYDLAGLVLTQAVATAMASDTPAAQALDEAAGDAGRAIGEAARAQADGAGDEAGSLAAAVQTLDAYGFSPRAEGDGYALGNCMFHAAGRASAGGGLPDEPRPDRQRTRRGRCPYRLRAPRPGRRPLLRDRAACPRRTRAPA